MQVRRGVSLLNCFRGRGKTTGSESSVIKRVSRETLPEVFEGRVDVKAAAVHVLNIGSRQFHFRDGQTCFVVLRGQKKRSIGLNPQNTTKESILATERRGGEARYTSAYDAKRSQICGRFDANDTKQIMGELISTSFVDYSLSGERTASWSSSASVYVSRTSTLSQNSPTDEPTRSFTPPDLADFIASQTQ